MSAIGKSEHDTARAAQHAKATVFIVDDDDGVRRALGTLMESVGYPHVAYASAVEFLRHYDAAQPGCLILDIRMPEMSGLELQLELNRRGYQIPVIFVTGHGDVPMAVDAMKKGAFDFVQKPFRDQDLLDRVIALCKPMPAYVWNRQVRKKYCVAGAR